MTNTSLCLVLPPRVIVVSLQCQAISATGTEQPMAKSGHSAVNIGQYVICKSSAIALVCRFFFQKEGFDIPVVRLGHHS